MINLATPCAVQTDCRERILPKLENWIANKINQVKGYTPSTQKNENENTEKFSEIETPVYEELKPFRLYLATALIVLIFVFILFYWKKKCEMNDRRKKFKLLNKIKRKMQRRNLKKHALNKAKALKFDNIDKQKGLEK